MSKTTITTTINAYRIDDMADDLQPFVEHELPDDPVLEEATATPTTPITAKPLEFNDDEDLPDWLRDDDSKPTLFDDEVPESVRFIRDKLRSVGNDNAWNVGDDIIVPAEIDRMDQRQIVKYLKENDYRLTDPNRRLWCREVEHA